MASLSHRYTLFETTSPRTPLLMLPEISLLISRFSGQKWDKKTQDAFTNALYEQDDNKGKRLRSGYTDLVARDRINRSPKKFGFVLLSPVITLSRAGQIFLEATNKEDILLRQFLKVQFPSCYHLPGKHCASFWVKPYLELFRLIRHFGSLSFDELMLFGLQLTDYHLFDSVVEQISDFRKEKTIYKGKYKLFLANKTQDIIAHIYAEEIKAGRTKTRQTKDTSKEKYFSTKRRNLRDYADSYFRHLRATGMVNISQGGHSLSIVPEKRKEVDYFLDTIDRDPCFVKKSDYAQYVNYLSNPELPVLLLDNKEDLASAIRKESGMIEVDSSLPLHNLKNLLTQIRQNNKDQRIQEEILSLKEQRKYDDIVSVFQGIKAGKYYDNALMFEWNAWRAMTMMDGGNIQANLSFDDFGNPLSTAAGNMADIVCDYGDFGLTVELTLLSGQRQFAAESEPVPRHLGRYKQSLGKQVYCLFVAPHINDATIAFFYGLHKTPIDFYGGETIIVPLELKFFEKMLEDAYRVDYIPSPDHIRHFFESVLHFADSHTGQEAWRIWYEDIKHLANAWLD